MKKIITPLLTLVFLCVSFMGFAQSPRMVMVEEATQASCPPCAAANPPLQALLNNNSDKAVFIAYQVWWPGVDAMFEDNPTEVESRIINDYYTDITGAPNIVVQGNSGAQATTFLTQASIDNIYSEMSEFDMNLSAEVVNGMLNISGDVTATMAATGDLRLRLVITEGTIYTEDLAFNGTNGETEFHHVFKKFVNGPAGITLSSDWAVGDTYTIEESFDLGTLNIYNYSELEVIGMIQNDDNKFVHQAAKASDLAITVDATNNVSAIEAGGLPANFCSGTQTVSPEFTLQNGGNDDLTSATITYNVNGGADETYDWTGSLSTFQNETITLPAVSFEAEATNTVNVTVSNPNGMTDEMDSDNMTSSIEVPMALTGLDAVDVTIFTDNYGDETYWEIRNSAGTVVEWGGNPNVGIDNINTGMFPPPADPASYANTTEYVVNVPFTEMDCYTFHITDYYGDGMSLSTSPAYWNVKDQDGNELLAGGNESFAEIMSNFQGDVTVGIEEVIEVNSVNIFPNPVTSDALIQFDLINTSDVSIQVTNTIGQNVFTKDLGTLASGTYNETVDMSNLINGFYLVQIRVGNDLITKKITVAK